MSGAVHHNVWTRSPQRGTGLLLMLALADEANDDGRVESRVSTLATKARTTVQHVRRLLGSEAMAGELVGVDVANNVVTGRLAAYAHAPARNQMFLAQEPNVPEEQSVPPTALYTPPIKKEEEEGESFAIAQDSPPPATFTDALAPAITDATGWDERLKNGEHPSWLRQCLGVLGRATGHDAGAATALLAAIVAHERWQFRPMTRADLFPRFLRSMVKELAAGGSVAAVTGAMLAQRCGVDLALAGSKARRDFEDIARAGIAARLTTDHLDEAIAAVRREPRFSAGGIPAWRLRQELSSQPAVAAVTR